MSMTLEEAIFEKYIRPTQRPAGDVVGVELEFPLLNLARAPVDIPLVQTAVRGFASHFGFTQQTADDNGDLYSLTDPVTGDNLSFDCSYNTLELSFGKEADINVLDGRFRTYFADLQERLAPIRHTLTGLGVNPYHAYAHYAPIANDRYRMLYHHLCAFDRYPGDYHRLPHFGMMAAASQVQLDVEEGPVLQTIRVFERLEPYKALLFANSYYDGLPALQISRDYFWEKSTQGYNPRNLGMFGHVPETLDAYISYVKQQSIYAVGKDGKYLHFEPVVLEDYVQRDSVTGEYYADGAWHSYTFCPAPEDIADHRTFKFEDLTYRGTIEFRSACEQPVRDAFCHAAFHAGLSRRVNELEALLDADTVLYHKGLDAPALRALLTRRAFPDIAEKQAVSAQFLRILDLAREGLGERGFGEEQYLDALYERAGRLTNPAQRFLAGLAAGDTAEEWIRQYGTL